MEWLAEHPRLFTSPRLSVMISHKYWLITAWKRGNGNEMLPKEDLKILYVLGPGLHLMWYKGRLVCFQKICERGPNGPIETLVVYTFGRKMQVSNISDQ